MFCDDGIHRQREEPPSGITMHQFSVPGIHNAKGIADWYRSNQQYTGGQMPYSIVNPMNGELELALPWNEVGPHALRWSSPTIGVVSIGDFNKQIPTPQQWESAIDIASELCCAYNLCPSDVAHLSGHTERPFASKTPGKVCPGNFWNMDKFREHVTDAMRESAFQRIQKAIQYR